LLTVQNKSVLVSRPDPSS